MIRKATERPKEVEYIEFKGKENFDEVAKFVGTDVALLTKRDGREQIVFYYNVSNEEMLRYDKGTIFYKAGEFGLEVTSKKKFFERYKEE